MNKTIRNLFLASCFLFAVSYDSFTLGVGYDNKYKIPPEIDSYSCTMTKIYGQRWERLGLVTFGIGTSLIISIFLSYRRKLESEDKNTLSLIRE